MHSLDKIRDHLDQLLGPPSTDPTPLELTLRTVVGMAAPALKEILPEDPQQLDAFLEHVAAKVLETRSDGAPLSEGFLMTVVDVVERLGAELGEEFAHRLGQIWHDIVMKASPAPPAAIAAAPDPSAPEPAPEAPAPVAVPDGPESVPEAPQTTPVDPQAPAAPATAPSGSSSSSSSPADASPSTPSSDVDTEQAPPAPPVW